MNPFAWLAVALGFLVVATDSEDSKIVKKAVDPKKLPPGTVVDVKKDRKVVVDTPPKKDPVLPKPKKDPKTQTSDDTLGEVEEWVNIFTPFLPILEDVVDEGLEEWDEYTDEEDEEDDDYYEEYYDEDDYYDEDEYIEVEDYDPAYGEY